MSDLPARLRNCGSNDIFNEAADRIEALEAELKRAESDRDWFKAWLTRREAELERVGQDARRYQWLRNRPPKYDSGEWRKYVWLDVAYTMHYDEVNERLGADLDAAIDSELDAEAAAQNVASARRPDETEPEGASQDTPQG
jgi:hypothetical protein